MFILFQKLVKLSSLHFEKELLLFIILHTRLNIFLPFKSNHMIINTNPAMNFVNDLWVIRPNRPYCLKTPSVVLAFVVSATEPLAAIPPLTVVASPLPNTFAPKLVPFEVKLKPVAVFIIGVDPPRSLPVGPDASPKKGGISGLLKLNPLEKLKGSDDDPLDDPNKNPEGGGVAAGTPLPPNRKPPAKK